MSMYRRSDHEREVTQRIPAHTSMSALSEPGKPPTTRVRRRISLFNRPIMSFVRGLIPWFAGNPGRRQAVVSPTPPRRRFAADLSLRSSISPATVPALAMADSRFSCATTAFRTADAHSL